MEREGKEEWGGERLKRNVNNGIKTILVIEEENVVACLVCEIHELLIWLEICENCATVLIQKTDLFCLVNFSRGHTQQNDAEDKRLYYELHNLRKL